MKHVHTVIGPSVLPFGRLRGRPGIVIGLSSQIQLPNRCCGCGDATYKMGVVQAETLRKASEVNEWKGVGPALLLAPILPILKTVLLGAALFRIGKRVGKEVGQLKGGMLRIPYCESCSRCGSPHPMGGHDDRHAIRLCVHPEFECCLREGRDVDPY